MMDCSLVCDLLSDDYYVKDSIRIYSKKTNQEVRKINNIFRFTEGDNYTDNFGMQWNKFKTTQLDSNTGIPLTFNRFWNNTKWKPKEIFGKVILEAGSGAGRFTEILLEAGAKVISFDFSNAVEANYANNFGKGEWFIFQGDIYDLPLKSNSFDYIFCYGVLQHTPDPDEAFLCLEKLLRPNGKISIDFYLKTRKLIPFNQPKYFWRRWTTKISNERLLLILRFYIPLWIDLDTAIRLIPKFGGILLSLIHIPCWNYIKMGLNRQQRIEWAIMDTFDALSAKFDYPKSLLEVENLMKSCNFRDYEVFYGSNGVVANGKKHVI